MSRIHVNYPCIYIIRAFKSRRHVDQHVAYYKIFRDSWYTLTNYIKHINEQSRCIYEYCIQATAIYFIKLPSYNLTRYF